MLEYCCNFCGETDEAAMMNNGGGRKCASLCRVCHNKRTIERGQKNKAALIAYKGGKCVCCGYDRCLDALDFHHKDPTQKDPSFKNMRYWKLARAKAEADKCVLVCATCHREIHSGFSQVPLGV